MFGLWVLVVCMGAEVARYLALGLAICRGAEGARYLALGLAICRGAEVARYLTSGLAQAHPVALILDIHVS